LVASDAYGAGSLKSAWMYWMAALNFCQAASSALPCRLKRVDAVAQVLQVRRQLVRLAVDAEDLERLDQPLVEPQIVECAESACAR
jgi:hypothetical protein